MRKTLLDSSSKLKSQVSEEKVRQMGITKELEGVLKEEQKKVKTNNLQATSNKK